jgi:phosphatidylinositol alpha-1,6-mannosyltransferase
MTALVLLTDAYGAGGGIAQYNRDLLAAMASFPRIEPIVVLPRVSPNPTGAIPSAIDFRREAAGSKARWMTQLTAALGRVRSADFVLCGHMNLLTPAYLAAVRYRCPLYLMVYGIEAWQPTPSRLTNALTARLDWVLSISQTTADRFAGWAQLRDVPVDILPNAIDLGAFGPGAKDPALLKRYGLEGKTVLMTFGRLAPLELKGFDDVMTLLPRLLELDDKLVYVIMGDGKDRARLQDKARQLGLESRVVFTGRIEEREKAAHYRLADLYVMPSRGEGFGFVFLEAMACGIPVVASRLDGGIEAVRNGQLGVLVDPRSPDDLERGIVEGLRRARGKVPEGLEYFAVDAFTDRVHSWLERAEEARANGKR